MKYTDLKDGDRVNVYIPATQSFYKMDVTQRHGCPLGGFSISNYGSRKNNLIDGSHSFLGVIRNQNDLDNFFYMQREPVTGMNGDESFKKAENHFLQNGKNWIY